MNHEELYDDRIFAYDRTLRMYYMFQLYQLYCVKVYHWDKNNLIIYKRFSIRFSIFDNLEASCGVIKNTLKVYQSLLRVRVPHENNTQKIGERKVESIMGFLRHLFFQRATLSSLVQFPHNVPKACYASYQNVKSSSKRGLPVTYCEAKMKISSGAKYSEPTSQPTNLQRAFSHFIRLVRKYITFTRPAVSKEMEYAYLDSSFILDFCVLHFSELKITQEKHVIQVPNLADQS